MSKAFDKIKTGLEEALEIVNLPPGVHVMSDECREILRKAAERGSKLAARHIKPGS